MMGGPRFGNGRADAVRALAFHDRLPACARRKVPGVMIRPAELHAIRAGTVDLAFRRWDRPRVLVGSRLRTQVGLLVVTSLDQVEFEVLTQDDARRAGAASLAALRTGLEAKADRPVWRVGLQYAGADPRVLLRQMIPSAAEIEDIRARLDRLDRASSTGPWTARTIDLIDRNPERRAPELAAEAGRPVAEFKRDVRKLKELGLTESLDIGYRLSPRGEKIADAVRRAAGGRARRRASRPDGTPLPNGIGAPATRALRLAGLTTLEAVARSGPGDVAALHGVGPIALHRLAAAMAEAGIPWA